MKSFKQFLKTEQRVVTFDHSSEPRSAIGAVDADRLVKVASVISDGPATERQFRLCLLYVNPRRDTGSSMDVVPAYDQPACGTVEELRAVEHGANDQHGIIDQALSDFESSPLYVNLTATKLDA